MKRKYQLLLGLALSGACMAQTSGTTNLSTSTVGKNTFNFLKKLTPDRISHFSILSGPSLDGNSVPNNADGTENKEDGINSWNQISFGYQLTEKTRFVFNPRFTMNFNQPTTGEDANKRGFEVKMASWVTGISSTWYSNGKLSFSGGLNTTFGTLLSETDNDRELEMNPGGFQVLSYQATNALSYGTWLWGRYRKYGNYDGDNKMPISIQPFVSYSLNDKVSFTTFYAQNGTIERDAKETTWDQDQNLNFLMAYQLTKNLSIQPLITLYRETNYDLAQGNLNFWISGRFY
jgi:hypothetical protein